MFGSLSLYYIPNVSQGRKEEGETYASWRRRASASAWRAPSFWSWGMELWTVNGVLSPLPFTKVEGVVAVAVGVGVDMLG